MASERAERWLNEVSAMLAWGLGLLAIQAWLKQPWEVVASLVARAFRRDPELEAIHAQRRERDPEPEHPWVARCGACGSVDDIGLFEREALDDEVGWPPKEVPDAH